MKFDPDLIKKLEYNDKPTFSRELSILDRFLRLKQSIGENWFFDVYEGDNLEGTEWIEVEFGFSASNIQISNDSSNMLMFSWDKTEIAGILYTGESLPFSQLERKKIYIKIKGKIRIWAF